LSDTPECIYRLVDHTLGELEWHEEDSCWETKIPFMGQMVFVDVYAGDGITDPTREQQLQAIETAHSYMSELPVAEVTLRRRAVKEILETAKNYGLNGNHDPAECISDLRLHSVSLHAGGLALHYRSPGLFPGLTTAVYCRKDYSCTSIEVYETHGL
jgi:hypothetical protein